MPLGTEVGLGPGDIVLDGDPAPPWKGAQQIPPLFGPCLLWPNGRPSQQLLSSCFTILDITLLDDKHGTKSVSRYRAGTAVISPSLPIYLPSFRFPQCQSTERKVLSAAFGRHLNFQ